MVGVVERSEIIDGSGIRRDALIGRFHRFTQQWYSLARKVLLEVAGFGLDEYRPELGKTVGEELLVPTKIYVRTIQNLLQENYPLRGMAHITGGGLLENVPRILPAGLSGRFQLGSWPVPPVFSLIQEKGPVAQREMFRTFNMGLGMVLVAPRQPQPKPGLFAGSRRGSISGRKSRPKQPVRPVWIWSRNNVLVERADH